MDARRTGLVELGIRTTKGASLRADLIRDRWLYLMLLVPLVHILVFLYIPMYGITIAFKEFNAFLGYWRSPWVGLKHFIRVFEDDHFWVVFLNTLKFGISSLIFGFPAPILFALLLNELRHKLYKGTVQTLPVHPELHIDGGDRGHHHRSARSEHRSRQPAHRGWPAASRSTSWSSRRGFCPSTSDQRSGRRPASG